MKIANVIINGKMLARENVDIFFKGSLIDDFVQKVEYHLTPFRDEIRKQQGVVNVEFDKNLFNGQVLFKDISADLEEKLQTMLKDITL